MDEKFSKISLTRVGGGGNFVFNFDPELFFFSFFLLRPLSSFLAYVTTSDGSEQIVSTLLNMDEILILFFESGCV